MTVAPAVLRLLDSLPQAVSVVDAAGRLAFANPAFWCMAGAVPQDWPPGTRFHDLARLLAHRGLYGPGDPEAQAAAALALDRSRPLRRVTTLADGSRSFETASVPMPDGGFLEIAHEVTTLLRAREEHAARAQLLETTLQRLSGGVVRFDAAMQVALFNTAYEGLIGLPGGTVRPGMTHRDLIGMLEARGEFDATDAPDAVAARMEADRLRPARRQRQRPAGQVLRFDSQPMTDGGFLVEVTDITALKHAENEARRRAALLDGVLEALPHGVCLYGPDRRVQIFNRAYAKLMASVGISLGDRLEDLVARRVASGEYDEASAARVLARFAPGREGSPPLRRVRPDGTALENNVARMPDGGVVSVFTDVTALHRAEEAARQRAAMLEASFAAIRHGIAIFGPDRRLLAANASTPDLTGVPKERYLPGRTFDELVDEQVAHGVLPPERGVIAKAVDRTRPHRFTRVSGDRVIEVLSDPTPDGGFVVTFADITALRRAEEELRRRAAILEASFGAMRHGIAVFGPDRRLLAANARTWELVGLPPAEPGASFDALVAEQVRLGEISAEQGRLTIAHDRAQPYRYTRPDGGGRFIEVLSDPTPDGGFVIIYSDVTALHHAEAELRRRTAMQAAMLGTIRHGIILYGPDRRVLASNAKTHELTGMPPDRLMPGRLMDEMLDEQVARGQVSPADAGQMKAFDRSRPARYARVRPDGRVLDTVSEPTPDGGFVITYSDVTEERAIRAELELASARAEAASEAKSRFLATMSHELRTPLNAVIGLSDAIAVDPDRARTLEYAAMINAAGKQLLQLVDDILDVARSQTGALRVAQDAVSPAEVIAEVAAEAAAAAAAAGLTLVTRLPQGLPRLLGDARRLRQVLEKLLSNAVKFTPAGGRVTLSAEAGPEGISIRVADTGIGIPAEERERMFEPFTQLDSSLARRFQGSGLGLHLARTLAVALGGTLTLEAPEGPGTMALLHFPADRLAPAQELAPEPAGALPA